MTPVKFDEIVKTRAAGRVQDKIKAFKKALETAMNMLFSNVTCGRVDFRYHNNMPKIARTVMAIMASDKPTEGWPSELWRSEEEAVSKELLGLMDEMQKALLATTPTGEDVCSPEETTGDVD